MTLSKDEVRFLLWLMGEAWGARVFNNPGLAVQALTLSNKLQAPEPKAEEPAKTA